MKKRDKKHTKHAAFKDFNISALEDHRRHGGKLSPPFNQLENTSFISWRDHGIHEVLWAVILRSNLEQTACLYFFRRIISHVRRAHPKYKDTFISHSALSALTDDQFDEIMSPVLVDDKAKHLLCALLYLECLPDRHHWERHLAESEPGSHSEFLMKGVSSCMDHQSQESTDIRWFKLMYCAIVQGRLKFPKEIGEVLEGFRLYPDYGDERSVRPRIRALELTLRSTIENKGHPFEIPEILYEKLPPPWSCEFWKECLDKTPCLTGEFEKPDHSENKWYFDQFFQIHQQVSKYFLDTLKTSENDAKRDSIYGLILYSISIALSIGEFGYHQRADGRILLRTIVENYITLKYLAHKDEKTIWQQFRSYGTGQTKLAFLKNLREETIPHFINLGDLHLYANEDLWQEYSNISIKPWSEKNLRKMAEESGIKDFYDKHYDWASAYVHGNWGAIRDTVFSVCLNPLHRYHRIPLIPRLDMPSVQPDTAGILNMMLDVLNQFYSPFKVRIKHQKE